MANREGAVGLPSVISIGIRGIRPALVLISRALGSRIGDTAFPRPDLRSYPARIDRITDNNCVWGTE